MRKLTLRIVLSILPVIIIIACVNYFGDPGHLFFNSKLEANVSNIMLAGNNVSNYPNDLNYRFLKQNCINNFKCTPQVVVIGSSRSYQINKDVVKKKIFFNSSVSSANLTDYLALYQLYRRKNILPQELIIGIDPWVLDNSRGENHNSQPNKIYEYTYFEIADDLQINDKSTLFSIERNLQKVLPENFLELFSLNYFKNSFNHLRNQKPCKIYKEIWDINSEDEIMLADGSMIYPKKFSQLPKDSVDARAILFAQEFLKKTASIKKKNIEMFEKFIQLIKKDKVTPIFLLTPYHPLTYEIIGTNTSILIDIENYLFDFAKKNNIKVVGSYDPNILNLTGSDFYDHYHVKPHVIAKIFNEK